MNYWIGGLVKRNQIKLYNRLKELTEREKPVSEYKNKDASHGHQVTRTVYPRVAL